MRDQMEEADTSTLLVIRENLWQGIEKVIAHFIAGTQDTPASGKAGDCSPAQFGATLTVPLFFKVNTILSQRGEEDWSGRLS